ncbi:RNA 2'-phosphotransferase [Methanocella sp. CWC-04]|uniref:Probable RNA 2'-phosphotransferase n=1 Tax=Methanooceanicella nereidis TaxID=2052831 RepID=A0AAP2W8E3_9EURY|nr:RNA 2'-phosphotransferase [Methanocella sp. CWC-04]MCD1296129.1 RNA 2'-phosphotransferase [Methanocella sp. CWC-04]
MEMKDKPKELKKCPQHGYFRGQECSCGNIGTFVLSGYKAEKLGKIISGALRHFPGELGLKMDSNGWVELDELEKIIQNKYSWASIDHIDAMFSTDEKGRYERKGNKVRARYGHSINIDLDYPEVDSEMLFYGTSEEEADRILEIGLKPVNQHYVHLSKTIEEAVKVACIRTEHPVIISLDAKKARENGIKILDAGPVCLAGPIPPEYIRI